MTMAETLPQQLTLSIGQSSSEGRKSVNQDFHGALIPHGGERLLKGIALAIADGISSSPISHEAAETIVKALMSDYYCTSDAWTVQTAATKVITATNAWLYAQNRKARVEDMNHGRVCTLSALIFKGRNAHLFHVGDSRVWCLRGSSLTQVTEDHRQVISEHESYLARSIGSHAQVDVDYQQIPLEPGDIYLLTTDGVHDFWSVEQVVETLKSPTDLDQAARNIIEAALTAGSDDNLTLQIAKIESLPPVDSNDGLVDETLRLPLTALPKAGDVIDGYQIVRPLSATARSHIFLATTPDEQKVVLKFPSMDLRGEADYLRRFVMEEWIARRINNAHVLKAPPPSQNRTALYTVTEYVEGKTLRQWLADTPKPSVEQVRNILEQVVLGLRAFHRREMLHQDLRPENIMIDDQGTVKLIDFGSTHVAGVQEISPAYEDTHILGTAQYTAPEYFLGYAGTPLSELFSLGVIAYEMLTGKLPYGAKVSQVRTRKDLGRLSFQSTLQNKSPLPDWIEFAIQKAVHPDSNRRQQSFTEFLEDLKRPNPDFAKRQNVPFIEKNPVRFWQAISLFFAMTTLFLLIFRP